MIEATENLSASDFAAPYREIFEAIQECSKGPFENFSLDVEAKLKHSGADVSGYWHLIDDAKQSITQQIQKVKEMSLRRSLFNLAGTLMREAREGVDVRDFATKSSQELADLLNGTQKRKEQSISDVMDETLEMIDKIRAGGSIGMKSGLDVDRLTQGFQKGMFYILAARPSMGKTALAVQLAQYISLRHPVAFLSLETTNKSLGMRYLANHARVDGDRIRSGKIGSNEMDRLHDSAGHLRKMNIILDDTSDVSASALHTKANYLKRKYGTELLIVDYVQLMKSNRDNREQQVAEISRACVSVAKDFDMCVLGLAQLNRSVEMRGGDRRPMLSDLRESGQLEQDAFCVMLLHRPEYYGQKTYPDGSLTDGVAEIIVAKHKDGPTGIKKLLFQKEIMRFENLQPEPEIPAF